MGKNTKVEKVGVAWLREFKNGKEGIKASIRKEIFIFYKNTSKKKQTDPDFVICKFTDFSDENKKEG